MLATQKLRIAHRLGSRQMQAIGKGLVWCEIGTLLLGSGCKSVQSFDTGDTSAYCLELVGSDLAESAMLPDTDAGADTLKLGLTIDSQNLSISPGRLWSNDAAFGLCSPRPLFDRYPIRTVKPALKDVVSSVQLTPDHIQDIFAWVDSTCQGTMLSIVSLIDGGSVEVRLFKPNPDAGESGTARQRSGFGVFARSR